MELTEAQARIASAVNTRVQALVRHLFQGMAGIIALVARKLEAAVIALGLALVLVCSLW